MCKAEYMLTISKFLFDDIVNLCNSFHAKFGVYSKELMTVTADHDGFPMQSNNIKSVTKDEAVSIVRYWASSTLACTSA